MNQLDIYCFTSIARTKSFSITARELMISQQAVSNHIKTLEEEVGYKLFFRYGQSAVLTKAGELMLEYFIKRDQLESDFFKEHKSEDPDEPFVIAWTQWAGCPEIPDSILKGFREEYPDKPFLIADLSAEKARIALKEKKIDILFTSQYSAEYMSTSWEHSFLCTQEICLIRSKRIEYDESELDKYPFFAVPAGETSRQTIIDRAKSTCEKMGFVPRQVTVCDDLGSAYLNVIANDGLSFGTGNMRADVSSSFVLTNTGVYSDYIMCSPFYPLKPNVVLFKEYVKKQIVKLPHRQLKEAGQ
ncbi:MAG: LysR family transcriptional regulator [Lachnospiraceae bacterium]|nr:LysR family transcriptional regulator [Lachnospiraceae bacterium]